MERNFYNDDFEELLKEKADQYKMYPSDKVWNGIQNSLHSKRKWYWIGFALLLSGVSYYAIEALVAPPRLSQKAETKITSPQTDAIKPNSQAENENQISALVIPLNSQKSPRTVPGDVSIDQPFYGVFRIDRSYSRIEPGATVKVIEMLSVAKIEAGERTAGPLSSSDRPSSDRPSANLSVSDFSRSDLSAPDKLSSPGLMDGYQSEIIIENTTPATKSSGISNLSGSVTENREPGSQLRFPIEETPAAEDVKKINWLQEFALHETNVPALKRVSWQLSFAPTMNYRRLSASKNPGREYLVKNIPMAMNVTGDIENLVNHTPAIGFELGSHIRYAADRNVTLKAGIQFNYARYSIEAFSATSTDVATIALNSTGGSRGDSLVSYSNISNFGGNSVKDLQNQYFQLSAPIGMEVRLLGGKRLQLRVAGTIQPTYLINRNTYLITTDYKNYTHEPSLVRRWNMNTSAEAFVSYNTGTISWQVGPQFRYQILSTYSSRYPIRENLMEYGVKIGVSKTIR